MNALYHWLYMGGYGVYIWSAYGLLFSVMLINGFGLKWQRRRVFRALRRWFKHQ